MNIKSLSKPERVPIEDVKVGDYVNANDGTDFPQEWTPIVKISQGIYGDNKSITVFIRSKNGLVPLYTDLEAQIGWNDNGDKILIRRNVQRVGEDNMNFDKTYKKLLEDMGMDAGAIPADAMSAQPYLDASLGKEGSDTKQAIYAPLRKNKKKLKKHLFKRKSLSKK